MIIRQPVNKPRWFGLTGLGEGTTPVIPPELQPDGDKVVSGYSYDSEEVRLRDLGPGVYLMGSVSQVIMEGTWAYYANYQTNRAVFMIQDQRNSSEGKDYNGITFPAAPFTSMGKVFLPTPGGTNKPSKNQYFVCPIAVFGVPSVITGGDLVQGFTGSNGMWWNGYRVAWDFTGQRYTGVPWYAITTTGNLIPGSDITPNAGKLVTAGVNDPSIPMIRDLIREVLFPVYEDGVYLGKYVNINLSEPYDVNGPTAFPYFANQTVSFGRVGTFWDSDKILEDLGFTLQSVYLGEQPNAWYNPNTNYGTPTTNYYCYRVMNGERPATFEETKPLRYGGVFRRTKYYDSPNFLPSYTGLWGTLIFGG